VIHLGVATELTASRFFPTDWTPLSLSLFWWSCSRCTYILDFTGARDDGDDDDNWSYKTCKAPVNELYSISGSRPYLHLYSQMYYVFVTANKMW